MNPNGDYSHLAIRPPAAWWVRFALRQATGKLLAAVPLLARVLRKLGHVLTEISGMKDAELQNRKYLELLRAPPDFTPSDDPFGYTGSFHELRVALKYHEQLTTPDFDKMVGETPFVYRCVLDQVGRLIESDPAIPCMLNFGVGYGHIDSQLAKRFPRVRFLGLDRAQITKLYNDFTLSGQPNLEFVAADVFAYLASKRFDGGIFFHVRTLSLLHPSFIEKLYKAARAAGFKHVFGLEQKGISRDTWEDYRFSDEPRPSVQYRGPMYVHNYPGLLKAAGFAVKSIELNKTPHPHPDYRLLSFVASR